MAESRLFVEHYVVEKDGTGQIPVVQFIKFLKSMGDDEETIDKKVAMKLEGTVQKMMNLGFTQEEAEAKVAELLALDKEEGGL